MKKINEKGQFQPFKGYSCACMVDVKESMKHIELMIKNSSLNKVFSALPYNSYHMTIYTIYICNGYKLPFFPEHCILEQNKWLPNDILTKQNTETINFLNKNGVSLTIQDVTPYWSEKYLGFLVTLNVEDNNLVKNWKYKLSLIYRHLDKVKLHITLAHSYSFSFKTKQMKEDYNTLCKMIKKEFIGKTLLKPSVYRFDNVTNFLDINTMFTSFG
ncbi:hypothetical protein AGMMS49579_03780 [Spirochaetia bacterium]|nr:hypothetical protein AGMMS49579_03780 [Spirochaetia bacterium]